MNDNNNQITAFNFEGSNVRTAGTAENPLFVAKDICDVLGIKNPTQALSRLDDDEKNTVILNEGIRGNPNVSAVNEFGLYALIGSSRKPEAKKFQRWVNHEVLPQIRKTGSYGTPKLPPVFDSATLLQISQQMARAEAELEQKQERIEALIPIAQFGNELMDSESLSCMTLIAKPLGISANRLNLFLHEKGVIHKVSGDWVPYARYDGSGHFRVLPGNRTVHDAITGESKVITFNQLKVYGLGRELAHRLWREAKA